MGSPVPLGGGSRVYVKSVAKWSRIRRAISTGLVRSPVNFSAYARISGGTAAGSIAVAPSVRGSILRRPAVYRTERLAVGSRDIPSESAMGKPRSSWTPVAP